MCSQKGNCKLCQNVQSYHDASYCSYHAWKDLKCGRCNQFVVNIIHNLIYYYFHKRSSSDHDVDRINQFDQHQNDMIPSIYEILCENLIGMEAVIHEIPILSRYYLGEEKKRASTLLLKYFKDHHEELKLLSREEFKNATLELLDKFVLEVTFSDLLLYFAIPNHFDMICCECIEKEQCEFVEELRKKPEEAIPPLERVKDVLLSDDLLGEVFSYLEFPKEFLSLSLVCKQMYHFLHYSTNFSWLSNLVIPNNGQTELFINQNEYDLKEFLRKIFKSFRGLTNLSSISKIYNFFEPSYSGLEKYLLLNKLFSEHNETKVSLDTIFMDEYGSPSYVTYYWLLKNKKPIRKIFLKQFYILTRTMQMETSKSFFFAMILKNSTRFKMNEGKKVEIECLDQSDNVLSLNLEISDNGNIIENGFPNVAETKILLSVPGEAGYLFRNGGQLKTFFMKDYNWLEKLNIGNNFIIENVWVESYRDDYTKILKNIMERGITIRSIILHNDYLDKITTTDREELLSITNNIEICQVKSWKSDPPLERWSLQSVIQ